MARGIAQSPVRPIIRGRATVGSLLVAILGLLVLLGWRAVAFAPESDGDRGPVSQVGGAALTPSQLKAAAAALFETATGPGGGGVTFEIVQHSSLHARPGGPLIEIPDPIDRYKSLGFTDQYELGSLIERGIVTADGFWMEMRAGPAEGQAPDFEQAPYQFGAIAKDGTTWRNDGEGWYATDRPPGIGLDPATAALLPTLLRNASGATDDGTESVDGTSARRIEATGRVADLPGIIAVDGEPFTALVGPIEFAFDDAGRLVRLRALARNENQKEFDLLVETVITFTYPLIAPAIPDPTPVWSPAPAPQD